MDVNAQLWQLKTLQRYFMGGVALSDEDYPMRLVVRPDKMQICARPANLSGASMRSGPIGGEAADRKHEHAGSLEFSRVPRKSKSSAESGRLQEGSRGLVRLADDRRTDAPYLIHIQRKLNMREAAATARSRRLGRKTGLSRD